ncbi:hypothetical protein D3C72_1411330 [compost metagenome]
MEMDVQGSGLEALKKPVLNESYEVFEEGSLNDDLNPRSKTSIRMHYEAQVSVIQHQLGNLDEIRGKLGLSQRKMAQLLMVDPSSWTRWTKHGDEAPPHIWRALQWYLALRDKIPGLTPQYFISTNPQVLHEKALKELDLERQERIETMENLSLKLEDFTLEKQSLNSEIQTLKKDLNFHKRMSIVILLLSISWAAVLFIWKGL